QSPDPGVHFPEERPDAQRLERHRADPPRELPDREFPAAAARVLEIDGPATQRAQREAERKRTARRLDAMNKEPPLAVAAQLSEQGAALERGDELVKTDNGFAAHRIGQWESRPHDGQTAAHANGA